MASFWELLPWNISLNQHSWWPAVSDLFRTDCASCLLLHPPGSNPSLGTGNVVCSDRLSSQRNVASSWKVSFRSMGVRILIKIWVKDILRNKKGKEAETNFNILTGMQHLPTTLITSRIYGLYYIQLFPGFALLQDRRKPRGEVKDDTHPWSNYTEKKNKATPLDCQIC